MRTTLEIDDDVLNAARALAEAENKTLGKTVSDLLRRALAPKVRRSRRNGVPLFEVHGAPVTLEQVNRLRDTDD